MNALVYQTIPFGVKVRIAARPRQMFVFIKVKLDAGVKTLVLARLKLFSAILKIGKFLVRRTACA